MKRVAIYLRVSTVEQADGTSLETQERTCKDYCRKNDLEIVKVFSDRGESAKTADRPEFQQMIKYCSDIKNNIAHVIVSRLDRLARNTYDSAIYGATLAKFNVTLLSATEPLSDDATGRFVKNMLSAMAELDNDIRGQRAKDGMLRVAEKGGWPFKEPLGFVCGRDAENLPILKEHPEQGPMVKQLFELAISGMHTLTGIQQIMNKRGWKATFGSNLYVQTAQKILTKPIYCGRIIGKLVGYQTIKARFKGLVDEHVFDNVQLILSGKGHAAVPHNQNNADFPLRNFVRCSECGWALTASFSKGRNSRYPYYRCRNKQCKGVNVRKGVIEAAFSKVLNQLSLFSIPKLKLFKERVLHHWQMRHAEAIAGKAKQLKRLEELEALQRTLVDKLLKGIISDAVYQTKTADLSAEIAICRSQTNDRLEDEVDVEAILNIADSIFRNISQLWERLGIDDRQRFQQLMFPDGLSYSEKEGFGTAVTSPFINVLQPESDVISRVARPRGIEPRFQG